MVHKRTAPLDLERGYDAGSDAHEGRMQTARREELAVDGKAPANILALKPDWGKPTVRNFRGAVETSASFEARSAPPRYPVHQFHYLVERPDKEEPTCVTIGGTAFFNCSSWD